jgi:hypothetical protein
MTKKIIHKVHGKRYQYKFNFETISKYINSCPATATRSAVASPKIPELPSGIKEEKSSSNSPMKDVSSIAAVHLLNTPKCSRDSSASPSPSPNDSVAQALEKQLIAQQATSVLHIPDSCHTTPSN